MASLNILKNVVNIVLLLSTYSTVITIIIAEPSIQHALACEHSTLSIQCAPLQEIRIRNANYGRVSPTVCNENGSKPTYNLNCLSGSSYAIVSAQCNGKESCGINSENAVFGDPCVNTYKYLDVDYDCVPKPSMQHALACEHSTLSIQCAPLQEIRIRNANYGRVSPTVCNENGSKPTYNLNCLSGSSYAIVSAQCNGKNSCGITAVNAVFGDPCVNTYKYLDVDYECVPKPSIQHALACEHSTLSIQCTPGQEIRILDANYGRVSPTICNDNGSKPTYNLNCLSGNSHGLVGTQCNGKESCSVPAENAVFGDPCVNTYKYLTVDYECSS